MYKASLSQPTFAFSAFCALLFLGSPVFAQMPAHAEEHSAHSAHQALDWPGIYYGFPPCADCDGIKTSLALNKNNSYILITEYAGKSPREFVEKGKFNWNDDHSVMVLTSRDGKNTHYYKATQNALTQLDAKGNAFTGKQAERYTLRRRDVTLESSGHTSTNHGGH